MCGSCCKAIILGKHGSPEFIAKEADSGNEDAIFIKENWVPISALEAFKLRPEAEFNAVFKAVGETYWWKCNSFDHATLKCKNHNARPNVCKGFPYYDSTELGPNFIPYSNNCGYLEDWKYLEQWKNKCEVK
jgi:Fe-S-cluster containining protein